MAATNVGTWLTSAAHASILLNLYAVHTVVLAHFLIPGDRLSVKRLAGVLVAYSGVVLLFAGQVTHAAPTLLAYLGVTAAGIRLADRTLYPAVPALDPANPPRAAPL